VSLDRDEKIEELSRQTLRASSDDLRLLIRNAVIGAPDLQSTVDPQPLDETPVAAVSA